MLAFRGRKIEEEHFSFMKKMAEEIKLGTSTSEVYEQKKGPHPRPLYPVLQMKSLIVAAVVAVLQEQVFERLPRLL